MKLILLAAAGGALGSAARYLAMTAAGKLFGAGFPFGTMIVNMVGCFLMGALIEAMALRFEQSQEARVFLATGVLGGFTTFSAFALDFAALAGRKAHDLAFLYLFGSVGLSILAFYAGMHLMRALLP